MTVTESQTLSVVESEGDTQREYQMEPFSVFWSEYTAKYLKNTLSSNVISNRYYSMLYQLLPQIPAPICSLILHCLGLEAINLSPPNTLCSEYKVWHRFDKSNPFWIGIEFEVSHEIRNVFGVEMDVNVHSLGQVHGELCSKRVYAANSKRYLVEMSASDDWENSDYLRLFFFGIEDDGQQNQIRVHLERNTIYRLAFAVRADLPVFYWRQGLGYNVKYEASSRSGGHLKRAKWGRIRRSYKEKGFQQFGLFGDRLHKHWSPNFRLLIA